MDVHLFVETVATALKALQTLKGLLPKLADRQDVQDAETAIREAEKGLEVANAKIASAELGYELCRTHWPPGIMLEDGHTGRRKCLRCGFETSFGWKEDLPEELINE